MGYKCERRGAPGAIVWMANFASASGLEAAVRGVLLSSTSGAMAVMSNSRWGVGGFKTGRRVMPMINNRRQVLTVSDTARAEHADGVQGLT